MKFLTSTILRGTQEQGKLKKKKKTFWRRRWNRKYIRAEENDFNYLIMWKEWTEQGHRSSELQFQTTDKYEAIYNDRFLQDTRSGQMIRNRRGKITQRWHKTLFADLYKCKIMQQKHQRNIMTRRTRRRRKHTKVLVTDLPWHPSQIFRLKIQQNALIYTKWSRIIYWFLKWK